MASAEDVSRGKELFSRYCMVCHGDGAVGGHVTPDLRALDSASHDKWLATVLGGAHWQQGMVGFSQVLSAEDARLIQQYVIERAHFALARGETTTIAR